MNSISDPSGKQILPLDPAAAAGVAALAESHRLRLLIVFGSVAAGRSRPDSDLDIGVLAGRQLSLGELGEIHTGLASLFPGREIDLGIRDRADPLFFARAMGGAILLCGSPQVFAETRMLAFRRYQDHRRFLKLERRYLDRIVEGRAE